MKNESDNKKQGQLVAGVIVIALGLMFLLDNLDIVNIHRMFFFWPMVLVGLGVIKVMQSRALGGYIIGAGLILLGVILFFSKLGLFHFSMKVFWPLVLIWFGFMLLNKTPRSAHGHPRQWWEWGKTDQTSGGAPDQTSAAAAVMQENKGVSLEKDGHSFAHNSSSSAFNDDEELLDITAVMGGYQRSVRTSNFRGGEINAIMGGCELDLRECSIKNGAVIQVFVAMGGVSIRVPPDWLVVLQGAPILGGFDEQTAAPPNSAKRLIVKGYAIMGGVEIRN